MPKECGYCCTQYAWPDFRYRWGMRLCSKHCHAMEYMTRRIQVKHGLRSSVDAKHVLYTVRGW
jgi:hypothetical protein